MLQNFKMLDILINQIMMLGEYLEMHNSYTILSNQLQPI